MTSLWNTAHFTLGTLQFCWSLKGLRVDRENFSATLAHWKSYKGSTGTGHNHVCAQGRVPNCSHMVSPADSNAGSSAWATTRICPTACLWQSHGGQVAVDATGNVRDSRLV